MSAAPLGPGEPGADATDAADVQAQSALLVDALLRLGRPAADAGEDDAVPEAGADESEHDDHNEHDAPHEHDEHDCPHCHRPGPRPGALATTLASLADATSLLAVGLRAMADALTEREGAAQAAEEPTPAGDGESDRTSDTPDARRARRRRGSAREERGNRP